jgi:hypothetical protein
MRHGADEKFVNAIDPVTGATSSGTTTGQIDTLGFGMCSIVVALKPDITTGMDAIAISEADTTATDFTSQSHIAGYDATNGTYTTIAFTPVTFTNTNSASWYFQEINVDLRGRKRYLNVGLDAPGTGYDAYAVARLSEAKIGVDTTTKAGVSAWGNG